MKIIFLGTGSAFTVGDNYHSNLLLEHDNGKRLLIDCGSDCRHSLHKIGLNHKDINDVYISHAHADHAGGLEWLGFTHKFDPSCELPRLFTHEDLAASLWEHTLSGGMRSIHEYKTNLSSYFDVHVISNEINQFFWEGIEIKLIQTIHVYDYDSLMPCYGIIFSINNKTIYLTADTQFTPDKLMPYYEQADLIFHDCETGPGHSGVHPHYDHLSTLDDSLKAKMWLYHYHSGPLPDAQSNGFRGFAQPRQVFDLKDDATYKRR